MSGHSKWHKIQHKKGVADKKRGASFTKLGNMITVAAREGGGDPEMNFSLRLAIDKAKQGNMPKENIERAIKRGTGESAGASLEEIIYEGFLTIKKNEESLKIPIIIQALTDNKNRTVAEVKHLLEKANGTMASPGAVKWRFEKKGVIIIDSQSAKINQEELELKLIDFGVEDIEFNDEDNQVAVYTKLEDLQTIKKNIEAEKIIIKSAEIEFVPKEKIKIDDEEVVSKVQLFFEQLDENQDVSTYFTNLEFV